MADQNFAKVACVLFSRSAPRLFTIVSLLLRHGPIFIGTVINIILYGISIAQTYIYFSTYKKSVLCFE